MSTVIQPTSRLTAFNAVTRQTHTPAAAYRFGLLTVPQHLISNTQLLYKTYHPAMTITQIPHDSKTCKDFTLDRVDI